MGTVLLSERIVKRSNEKIRKYQVASPSNHLTWRLPSDSLVLAPCWTNGVSLSRCLRGWLEESRSSLRAVSGGGGDASSRRLAKWFELPKGRDAGRGGSRDRRERAGAKMDKVSSNPLQPRHWGPPENFQINEAIFFRIMSRHQRRVTSALSDAFNLAIIFHHVLIPICTRFEK